jgi:hypothetical protein
MSDGQVSLAKGDRVEKRRSRSSRDRSEGWNTSAYKGSRMAM